MHSESTFSYHPAWYNWIFKATLSACHSATAENITWHLNFIGVKTNRTNTQHSSNSSPKISLDRVLSMEGKSLYKSWPRATFWYRGALRNPVIENPWPRCSSLQSNTRPSTSTKCWPPCSRRSPGMGPDGLETTLFCTVDQTRWIWRASAACPCRRQLGLPQAEEQLTRQMCFISVKFRCWHGCVRVELSCAMPLCPHSTHCLFVGTRRKAAGPLGRLFSRELNPIPRTPSSWP